MTVRYWKFLRDDLSPCHSGVGAWTVGEWRSVTGNVVACENGIHACREQDLPKWIGPALHPIALSDDVFVHDNEKVVARSGCIGPRLMGWNEQTARLFAADCAAQVKHLAKDERVSAAIIIARARAFELVGPNVWTAARDAARDAARAAAWDAARDAARAWQGCRILAYACGGIDLDALRLSTANALPSALKVIGVEQ